MNEGSSGSVFGLMGAVCMWNCADGGLAEPADVMRVSPKRLNKNT